MTSIQNGRILRQGASNANEILEPPRAGFFISLFLLTGQTNAGVRWTEEELVKDVAVRTLRVKKEVSFHAIRLRTAEQPHIHEVHDVTVIVRKGRARVHLGDEVREIERGDRIVIPRGTVHWAENLGPDACEVYAIFRPAYDGTDYVPLRLSNKNCVL